MGRVEVPGAQVALQAAQEVPEALPVVPVVVLEAQPVVPAVAQEVQAALRAGPERRLHPVSYTHLTLPTICSV